MAASTPTCCFIAKSPGRRATATSNTFISFVCEQIRRSIYYARQTNPLHDLVEVNVGEHVRIYEALVAGDPAAAEAAMRAHIIGAADRVGVKLPLRTPRNEEGK